MKKLVKYFFFIGLLIVSSELLTTNLFAADAGVIQLSVAAPDPVVAGEDVTFQVIAVNTGSNQWPIGQYYVETEIYDAQKNFLAKTDQIKGATNVDPGQASLLYIPFSVPSGYVGTYFYRIFVVYKEQRVVQSDYYTFNVIPLPISPKKPSNFKLGGNATISYKQTSLYNWGDYTGNLNLNLVGQLMDHAMLFNMYTFHTPKSTSAPEGVNNDIYSILFNYYGDNYTLGLGDVLPVFSPLSLYGTGMRGGEIESKLGDMSLGAVAARTQKAVEGTSVTDGTYERWLMGGKLGYEVLPSITVGGSYVASFDRQDSLTTPGPSVTPASNYVSGGMIQWNPADAFGMEAEYQTSQYLFDLRQSSSSVNDYAYRVMMKLSPRNFNLRADYQVTRPNFYAFGSPGATRDRQTVDLTMGYLFFNRLSVNAGANRFKDNLDNDAAKVTTTQSIYNGGVAYSAPNPWPSPYASYSLNEAVGDPVTAENNNTKTMTLGLTGRVSIVNLGVTYQQSDFRDLTKIADDLSANTMGLTLNTAFGSRASVNVGATMTNTKNLIKLINNQTPAYSMSLNLSLVPGRLTSQIWGTYIIRQNDAPDTDMIDKVNRQETTGNAELSWLLGPSLTWTVGGTYAQTRDDVVTVNNLIQRGVNTRLSYSF